MTALRDWYGYLANYWRPIVGVLTTFFSLFWLAIYLWLYLDEAHIIGTDHTLRFDLTRQEVFFDVARATLICVALATVVAAGVYGLNRVKEVPRSGWALAIVCWSFMVGILLWISIGYYLETSARLSG